MKACSLLFLPLCVFACFCPSSLLGNGECDEACYTPSCAWDLEDCKEEECAVGCLIRDLTNGVCDSVCMTPECHYDAQDCANCEKSGCPLSLLGNGECDYICATASCGFDHGDCRGRSLQTTTPYVPQNYGLVAGVGLGTFLIIFSGALGLVVCFCGSITKLRYVCFVLGGAIPLIVICIILFSPTKEDEFNNTDTRVDNYVVARIMLLVVLIPCTLLAIYIALSSYVTIELKTRRVDSRSVGEATADLLDKEEGPKEQTAEQVSAQDQSLSHPPEFLPMQPLINPR